MYWCDSDVACGECKPILYIYLFFSVHVLVTISILATRRDALLSLTRPSCQIEDRVASGRDTKLGDAPGRHRLFRLQSIGNVTWGYIFIHHMLCVLLGAYCFVGLFLFCCVTIILAAHLERETCTHRDFVELHLYPLVDNSAHMCFTYIFWARWFCSLCFTYIF